MATEIAVAYISVIPSLKNVSKRITAPLKEAIPAIAGEAETAFSKVPEAMKQAVSKATPPIAAQTESAFSRIMGSMSSKIGGGLAKIGKLGMGTIGGLGTALVGLAAKGGFERALNTEKAQVKLKALGHDTASVKAIMEDARKSVQGTAFGMDAAATVAATLSASGIKAGKDLESALTTVADVAQVSGRSMTDIGMIFSSIAARGKLQGDDMLQLMSSGIPVLQALASHLGITSEEASAMVSKGEIDFATFQAAMEKSLGGAAKKSGDSFSGAMANVKAALSRVGASFAAGPLDGLRRIFLQLIPVIDTFGQVLKPVADAINKKLEKYVDAVVVRMEAFSKGLQDGSRNLKEITGPLQNAAMGFAALYASGVGLGKMPEISEALSSLNISIPKDAGKKLKEFSGNLSEGFSSVTEWGKKAKTELGAVNSSLKTSLAGIGDAFNQTMPRTSGFASSLKNMALSVKDGATNVGNSGFNALKSAGSRIASGASTIGSGVAKAASPITSSLGALGTEIGSAFTPITSRLSSGMSSVTSTLSSLGSKIGTAVSPLKDTVGSAFGNLFGGAESKVTGSLGKLGEKIGSFFNPGNFLKFMAFGALASAAVAGLGMVAGEGGAKLLEQVTQMAQTLPSQLMQTMQGFMAQIPNFMSIGSQIIQTVLQSVIDNAPSLMLIGAQILEQLMSALGLQLPTILPQMANVILAIVQGIIVNLPLLIDGAMNLLVGLVDGIIACLPVLMEAAPLMIDRLLQSLLVSIPKILESGTKIVEKVINGITQAIPKLVTMVPQIIQSIITTLLANLPKILETGVKLLVTLVTGIVNALPQLIAAVPKLIVGIVQTLINNLPQIINTGFKILTSLVNGLMNALPQLLSWFGSLPGKLINLLAGLPGSFLEIGKNMIQGLINGAGSLLSNIGKFFLDMLPGWIVKPFKWALGINSPSKVFAGFGVNTVEGFLNGVEDQIPQVKDTLGSLGDTVADTNLPSLQFAPPEFGEDGQPLNRLGLGNTITTVINYPNIRSEADIRRDAAESIRLAAIV